MVRQAIAGTLMVLAPISAAAQAQTKGQVMIRALANPSLQIVGSAPFDAFLFTQDPCDRHKRTLSAPAKLQLDIDLEDRPEQPVDVAIDALRQLAKRQMAVEVATSEGSVPPKVMVVWGGGLPAFEGVVESVGVKYTMFSNEGIVLRAVANVSMKAAGDLKTKDKDCF